MQPREAVVTHRLHWMALGRDCKKLARGLQKRGCYSEGEEAWRQLRCLGDVAQLQRAPRGLSA